MMRHDGAQDSAADAQAEQGREAPVPRRAAVGNRGPLFDVHDRGCRAYDQATSRVTAWRRAGFR